MRFRLLLPHLLVSVALLLSGCGDLPEPFLGNPGATARRLAVPATPMLAIPPPSDTLLPGSAGSDFADLLALSLQKEEIPSLARPARKTDWRLAVTAARRGETIVPRYAVQDPSGHEQGAIDGTAIPAAGWTSGSPAVLGQAAKDALPKILALMTSIRATRDHADPNSLLNRVAKLYVPEVTGAPGDGNPALTRLIRSRLGEFGPLIQVTPENTDFTVKGQVFVSPLPKSKQQVEIAWAVTRPSGVVVGKVSQLNSVPSGTLDTYWGDVAVVVAQEAASGINTVVERFIGRDAPTPAATSDGTVKPPAPASIGASGSATPTTAGGTPTAPPAIQPSTTGPAKPNTSGAAKSKPTAAKKVTKAAQAKQTSAGGTGSPPAKPAAKQ